MVLIMAAEAGRNARGLYDAAFLQKLIGRNVASIEPLPKTGCGCKRPDHKGEKRERAKNGEWRSE